MCTVFNPAVGDFIFFDGSFSSQAPTGWSMQTNSNTNPTQMDFLFNGIVRASVSIQGNENFESGWPRWSPAGNFVAVGYGSLSNGARTHVITIIDIRAPDDIPPHLSYGPNGTENTVSESATAFTEMRTTSDDEAVMCLVNLNGVRTIAHQVYRTFDGNSSPICSFGDVLGTSGQIGEGSIRNARITSNEEVEIFLTHQDSSSITVLSSCDLPRGELLCGTGPELNFAPVVIGGTPASTTQTIDLFNVGDDCIEVSAIANAGPFSVTALEHNGQAVPLPLAQAVDLLQGEVLEVEITFQPTTVGQFEEDLLITRTPARGCDRITCIGEDQQGEGLLTGVPNPLSIGNANNAVPVGEARTLPLTIRNSGNLPVDVAVAAQTAGIFQWPAIAQTTLQPNDTVLLDVTFEPVAAGTVFGTITAASANAANASGGTVLFDVEGTGCIPAATLSVNPTPTPFGQVERGFRAVRTLTVLVNGNMPLNYSARIENDAGGLFGIQEIGNSLIDAAPVVGGTIRPGVICGGGQTGTGERLLAVVFWANGDSSDEPHTAELVVSDETAIPPIEVARIPLEAMVVETAAIDAALVLDRSFSMNQFTTDAPQQPSGDRRKVNACITAAHLMIDLVRPEIADRIGVVRFNQNPEPLRQMTVLGDTAGGNLPTKQEVKDQINTSANSLEPAGSTGLAGGVLIGADELARPREQQALPNVRKVMVVLTDGMGNRAFSRDGSWFTILGGASQTPDGAALNDTEPVPLPGDVRVHAIGIGSEEDIDRGQLAQLSETTGGEFYVVDDLTGQQFFEVEKLFLQIFLTTIDWQSIEDPVFLAAIGARHEHTFDLLKGDFGGMVVVFHDEGSPKLPFELVTPSNELVTLDAAPDGFSVRTGDSSTGRYIEFRCPASQPDRYAGQWKIVVKHPAIEGSQGTASAVRAKGPVKYGFAIGAGSNFRMDPFVTPGLLNVGDVIDLTASITEVGLPVSGCDVTVDATSPSGQTRTLSLPESSAREYTATFPHTAEGGSYRFHFRATGQSRDGEPVKREATRSKYVQGRVPIIGDPKPSGDDCCERQTVLLNRFWRVLIILAILLALVLLVLFFK